MARAESRKNVAFAVLAVALLLVAGITARRIVGKGPAAAATPPPAAAVATADPTAGLPTPVERLLFQADSDHLPTNSLDMLARFADAARAASGAMVEISAFYPPGGDAVQNADLAQRRAQAVRHALEANGVTATRIRTGVGAAPAVDDARAAGRVELALR